jgi:hypothetical protein
VKRIVRYLKVTRDQGLIIKPDATKGVQCYIDADFVGGYSAETSGDPVSVFSRSGYVIFYLDCPVIWVSKIQSEISLSTVEAVYVALSQSMRDLIPLLDYIKEMDKIFEQTTEVPNVCCSLFEDNNGALELARTPYSIVQEQSIQQLNITILGSMLNQVGLRSSQLILMNK